MTFPSNVERWRAAAQAELSRQRLPLPTELVLAVIKKESGGDQSAISSVGAMGLMQVMPNTLRWYNDSKGTKYTDAQFKQSAALQIKVGIWVLKGFWQSAYRYLVKRTNQIGVDLLSKAASLFYVFGPGRARKYWDKTQPTYEAFAARYSGTDPIKNGYATKIWDWANSAGARWQPDAINSWLGGDAVDDGSDAGDVDDGKTKTGALVAILIMVAAYQWLSRKG